jgi:hypothetical protein
VPVFKKLRRTGKICCLFLGIINYLLIFLYLGVQEHGGTAGPDGGLSPADGEILPRLLLRGLPRPLGGGGEGERGAAGGDTPHRGEGGGAPPPQEGGQGGDTGDPGHAQPDMQHCSPGTGTGCPDMNQIRTN